MMNALFLVLSSLPGQVSVADRHLTPLFDAIRMVETGAEERPENAVGDGGKSLVPDQISRKYLIDSGMGGSGGGVETGGFRRPSCSRTGSGIVPMHCGRATLKNLPASITADPTATESRQRFPTGVWCREFLSRSK